MPSHTFSQAIQTHANVAVCAAWLHRRIRICSRKDRWGIKNENKNVMTVSVFQFHFKRWRYTFSKPVFLRSLWFIPTIIHQESINSLFNLATMEKTYIVMGIQSESCISNGNAGVSVSVYVCQNLNDDIETENAVLDFIRFEPICWKAFALNFSWVLL